MTINQLALIDTKKLPTQLRFLVVIIGLNETLALVNARGGRVARMPITGNRETALDGILGSQSIVAICNSHLSGQRLTLPKPDKIYMQIRNINILAEKGKHTKAELARKYKLTTRTIQKIWNEKAQHNIAN
ncbi:hypothetical protein JYT79_00045 [Cardiobacterium sp. AH-315-I02]|nr:hypothetical protein [Cardiobacterium sp. AH-315-I02]